MANVLIMLNSVDSTELATSTDNFLEKTGDPKHDEHYCEEQNRML